MRKVLFIPLSYPFNVGGEDSFLREEVKLYADNFDKVDVLPSIISETRVELDSRLNLDLSLALHVQSKNKTNFSCKKLLVFLGLFLPELLRNPIKLLNYYRLKRAISDSFAVVRYLSFFNNYFADKKNEGWIIYTYWFTPITTAAALFSRESSMNIKVVTRAHGIDLYESRNNNYIPFRAKTIELLDRYFFVSNFGRLYTEMHYPRFKSKYTTFGLGIKDLGVKTSKSEGHSFRIVSCSSIDENKRVDLIVSGIEKFAAENVSLNIIWDHFGSGPLVHEIEELARARLLGKVEYHLWGHVNNSAVTDFYKNNAVDVFITTTASEGGRPVSISEALCCSIPVIATSVGGIPELVNESNGILLSENPSIEEIKNAINWFVVNSEKVETLKESARKMWENECNADRNCEQFVDYLSAL